MTNHISPAARQKVFDLIFTDDKSSMDVMRNYKDYTIVGTGPVERPEKPIMQKSSNWLFSLFDYFSGRARLYSEKYVHEMNQYLRECVWADARWTVTVVKTLKDLGVEPIPIDFVYRRIDLSCDWKGLIITLKRNRCSVFLDDLVEMLKLVPGELEVLLQPTSARDEISYFVVRTVGESLIYCPGLWTVKVKWVD